MKKLLFGIIIIGVPVIIFFQYQDYRRFNPPASYEYSLSDDIDVNYHDSGIVSEYFEKGVEIGSYARMVWTNDEIDVRFPDQNSQIELNASTYYNQLLSRVKLIETKLKNSSDLKLRGLSNDQVKLIESGIPEKSLKFIEDKQAILALELGDSGRLVWELQKRLNSNGYEHVIDGVYGVATQNAVIAFQNENQFYPSGVIDEDFFEVIFLN